MSTQSEEPMGSNFLRPKGRKTRARDQETARQPGKVAPTLVLVLVGSVIVAATFFNFERVHLLNLVPTSWMSSQESSLRCDSNTNITRSSGQKQDLLSSPKTKAPVGGIFICGYPYFGFGRLVFPDYASNTLQLWNSEPSTNMVRREPSEYDILLHGMRGPCIGSDGRDQDPFNFPGKILFIQGEAFGGDWALRTPHHAIEGIYQIGMLPDTPHSIVVVCGIITLMNDLLEHAPALLDPTRKPKNTGEHAAIIYLAHHCVPFREQAVGLLSTIFPVHYGSECKGIGDRAIPAPDRDIIKRTNYTQMITYTQTYQFCLVMENQKQSLYMTEKLVFAFVAGCIPIYYGADEVFDVFNQHAFVYYNVSNPAPALKQIKYLKQNQTAYLEMINDQPILAHGEETVRDFFSFSDAIGGGLLRHKLRALMGIE